MESKRLALAFGLSAAVLILWTILFPPERPKPGPAGTPGSGATATAPVASAAGATTPPAATAAPVVPAGQAAAQPAATAAPRAVAVTPIAAAEPRDYVVSTALYTARLSNRGGDLTAFALKKFQDHAGQPLDLVRHGDSYPGRILTLEGDAFLKRAATALHEADVRTEGLRTIVRFRYREPDGNAVTRTYTFGDGYVVSLRVERQEGSDLPVAVELGPGLGNPSPEELQNRYTKPGSSVTLSASGSVTRHAKDGLKEPLAVEPGVMAAGVEDNYFVTAFLPAPGTSVTLRPVAVETPPAQAGGKPGEDRETEVVASAPGVLKTDVFLGPKQIDVLEAVRPGLEKLIDYGWFAILAKPLLWMLKGLYAFSGNWGVAIILITGVIKILLFPLTYKQLVSMKKMSALQPKVEALKIKWAAKIKTDPEARAKMNEEMMGLYRNEGVNPAGGCLPLLLQMPILIAFYNLLAHAIELRHAPFALWIQDLSAKDPWYVTPILMTATMWLQQQMTPATGDATTRRMMAFLPLVFGFMFKDMPSGLVLYWLVQNVLSIAQQLLLERYTDLGIRPKAKKA